MNFAKSAFVIVGIAMFGPGPFSDLIPAARAQNQLWITQFGTSDFDYASALAPAGAGGVMIAGYTDGNLGGAGAGGFDAWLARFDAMGNQLWIVQFGTSERDEVAALAPDGAGGVFVAGRTEGSLFGPSQGRQDAWLARYDGAGNQLWARQYGTAFFDWATGLVSDGAGGVMVGGHTGGSLGGPHVGNADVYLARYDSAGTRIWIDQFGTTSDEVTFALVSDDAGGAVVAGYTNADLVGQSFGNQDAFLARYNGNGNRLWTRQFGTITTDWATALAMDSTGGVMVGGMTRGDLAAPNAGIGDVFLARFDTAGNQLWIRQFGSPNNDMVFGMAHDGTGGLVVTGSTEGSLGGPNTGLHDAFLIRYDSAGSEIWAHQFGTTNYDDAWAVTHDGVSGAVVAGYTRGELGGPNAGIDDVFVTRFENATCYADCDQSTGIGVLDVFDFLCFQNAFVTSDPYACDCDTSTGNGVCDVFDFLCFQNAFVGGCP